MLKKLNKLSLLLLLAFLGINFQIPVNKVHSEERSKENLLEDKYKFEYILGSGDTLEITFRGIDLYSGKYTINPEGFLNLPEINNFYAKGKTIKEVQKELHERFTEFIIIPEIDLKISYYRPVDVFISGEVNKPGLYTLTYDTKFAPNNPIIRPTLFKALQIANGFTNTANIAKIKIIRENSISQGGGKIETYINLLPLFMEGDQAQNIRILDGDSIIVSKSKNSIKEQILAINRTNITNEKITVFITGNVAQPGIMTLKKGSSLVQAIASTGGKKILTGKISFVRFSNEGNNEKYKFKYDPKAKVNTRKNPILMEGDIVNVEKSVLGNATEILGEISNPVISGYGLYNIIF